MNINTLHLLSVFFIFTFVALSQTNEYSNNEIIVKLKEQQSFSLNTHSNTFEHVTLDNLNKEHQIKNINAIHKSTSNKSFLLTFENEQDILHIAKEYENSGLFEYVELNYISKVHGALYTNETIPPNDLFYHRQWALKNDGTFNHRGAVSKAGADMKMEQAWEIETGSDSIIVAVIDTGVLITHPELNGRIWQNPNSHIDNGYLNDNNGWNFAGNNNDVNDSRGHGTSVAGIIATNSNNNIGFAGIDWNCKIMPLKVFGDGAEDGALSSDVIEAIYYAVDNGANIINMSLGGSPYSVAYENAINYAYNNNVTIIASMGNDNTNEVSYPAGYLNTIAVGASNPDDTRVAPFYLSPGSGSNYGYHIDVIAPGEHIFAISNSLSNYTLTFNGTSAAAPHVSGLASLLLAQDPTRSPDDLRQIINDSADDEVGPPDEDTPGHDMYFGHGRINAFKALNHTLSVTDNKRKENILYPNPTTDHFFIQNSDYSELKIFSATGKLVHSQDIQTDTLIQQNVKDLSAGIYIVHLKNNKGQVVTKKLIVK